MPMKEKNIVTRWGRIESGSSGVSYRIKHCATVTFLLFMRRVAKSMAKMWRR